MQALLKFGDWVKIDKLGMKLHETAVFFMYSSHQRTYFTLW